MSFVSSAVIAFLEKELSASSPEVEAWLMQQLGVLASDVVNYIENRLESKASPAVGASA